LSPALSLRIPDLRDESVSAGLFFAVTLGMFFPTLWEFPAVWSSPTYAHGYLVAGAIVWLVWRERRRLRWHEGDRTTALGFSVGLSFVWLCATVMGVRSVAQAVLPALLFTWAAAALGPSAARRVAPIAAFALLAVPVWEVIIPPLQALTTIASGIALRLLRVPAVITGNVVEIEYGTFLIADGCAGLSYLLAGLTIGSLYGLLFLQNWSVRLRVLAAGAGIAIVGNWIRVASLIVIGQVTRMQSRLVEAHLTFGWAIFALGLLVFFPLARRMGRREATTEGAAAGSDAPEPSTAAGGRAPAPPALRAGAWATLAATAGPLLYYGAAVLPGRELQPPSLAMGTAWQPRAAAQTGPEVEAWRPAFAGATDRGVEAWTSGSRTIVGHRILYTTQRQGAELIGYDNRIAPDSALVAERLFGPVGARRRLVNEAIVRDGDGYLLVWYWYRVGGVETESAARAKLLELWAFARRARVSELIALSTTCDGDSCTEASRALADFLGAEPTS
jgi:EpsI family protein